MVKAKYYLGIAVVAIAAFFGISRNTEAKDSNGDYVVIVDAGHGGIDGGAASFGKNEDVLNWNIACALKAELETYAGVRVYFTRGSAEWNTNTARGRMGKMLSADLIVSCHNNSSTDNSVRGVSVYGTIAPQFKSKMQTLASSVCEKIAALGITNRGYMCRPDDVDPSVDYYTVLAEAAKCNIPGIIIEHVFLSNSQDSAWINTNENQIKCGVSDATAIASYLGLSKRGVAPGESIVLHRTYSAHIVNGGDSFTSSNNKVAYVNSQGIITAVGTGSAEIKCNGKVIKVTVPEVKMMGIAAGLNPTFYEGDSVKAFDKSKIIVKAVYSDGSVKQITSGYTVGSITKVSEAYAYDIPIKYNGFSCNLRLYNNGAYGSYSDNHAVNGTNADILKYPVVYNGINTGIAIKTGNGMNVTVPAIAVEQTPTEAPAPAPTETPTEAPTETPAATEAVTTEAETSSQSEAEVTMGTSEMETKVLSEEKKDNKSDNKVKIYVLIAAIILMVGIIVTLFLLIKNRKSGGEDE